MWLLLLAAAPSPQGTTERIIYKITTRATAEIQCEGTREGVRVARYVPIMLKQCFTSQRVKKPVRPRLGLHARMKTASREDAMKLETRNQSSRVQTLAPTCSA
jgi:hypothetical protein